MRAESSYQSWGFPVLETCDVSRGAIDGLDSVSQEVQCEQTVFY